MAAFTPWTRIFFKNATAPTGWTKDISVTYDHGLRIVNSTLGSPTSISQQTSQPFSGTMVNVTVPSSGSFTGVAATNQAVQDVPSHTHTATGTGYTSTIGTSFTYYSSGLTPAAPGRVISRSLDTTGTSSAGNDGLHSHPSSLSGVYTPASNINFAVKYTDLLLAYKNDTASRSFSIVTPVSVNEGDLASFTVNTVNVPDGTILTWNFVNYSMRVLPSVTTGNFVINSNTGSFSFKMSRDFTTTGPIYFQIELIYTYYQNSVLLSPLVTVNDISNETTIPTYTWTPATSINEGVTTTYTVNMQYVDPGNVFNWKITNINTSAADFFTGATSGTFTSSGTYTTSSGSFTITTVADTLSEGPETFTLQVLSSDNVTVLLATTVTVNDTSRGVEGQVVYTSQTTGSGYFNVSASNTRYGGDGPSSNYSWTVPAGVTSISVVAVGSDGGYARYGGGGGGGALAYVNNIPVTPGATVSIAIGYNNVYNYTTSPTFTAFGGATVVSIGSFTILASGGNYGTPYTLGNSGGGGGSANLSIKYMSSGFSGTLSSAITTVSTGSVNITTSQDVTTWPTSGKIIIGTTGSSCELMSYSSRGITLGQSYVVLDGRGLRGTSSGNWAAGTDVKIFEGDIHSGGSGYASGSSTTRGAQGGSGQYTYDGSLGSGIGVSLLGTVPGGGVGYGSGFSNGGVRIMWAGASRKYPATNVADV